MLISKCKIGIFFLISQILFNFSYFYIYYNFLLFFINNYISLKIDTLFLYHYLFKFIYIYIFTEKKNYNIYSKFDSVYFNWFKSVYLDPLKTYTCLGPSNLEGISEPEFTINKCPNNCLGIFMTMNSVKLLNNTSLNKKSVIIIIMPHAVGNIYKIIII